jgi:hypothetical protein
MKSKKIKNKMKTEMKMKVTEKNVKHLETKKIDTHNQSEIHILNQKIKYVKQSHKLFSSLNAEEKKVLNNYKYTAYHYINLFLRNNYKFTSIDLNKFKSIVDYNREIPDFYSITTDNISKYIEYGINKLIKSIRTMDNIFEKKNTPKLTENDILYRGINAEYDVSKFQIGKELDMESFLSCSFNVNIAEAFTSAYLKNESHCCMFVIKGYKDVPFIYLQWNYVNLKKVSDENFIMPSGGDEHEIVLPRGCKFKITDIHKYIPTKKQMLKNISTGKVIQLLEKKYKTTEINEEIYEKEISKMFSNLIVVELEYVSRTTIPINDYVYDGSLSIKVANEHL